MVGHENRQQASVVFGYDQIEYQSSISAMNQFAGKTCGSKPQSHIENINKACHVQFGERGKKRDFTTSSRQLDPTGEMHKYTAKMSAADKDMLARTSAGFGNETSSYVTSTQLATQWNKAAVQETVALRNEIRMRTGPRPTRGISYDDEVEYISEAKSAFENKCKGFKPSIMAESVKNGAEPPKQPPALLQQIWRMLMLCLCVFPCFLTDLRATHFSLGHEKLEYRTSSHIDRLSPEQFALYATRQPPLHDLKKSTVEIT